MSKPLANWDDKNSTHELLVWWSRLDERFQIEVQRTGSDMYQGMLYIFDHFFANKIVYSQSVSLMYGAVFGADVDDVQYWMDLSCRVVDEIGKTN